MHSLTVQTLAISPFAVLYLIRYLAMPGRNLSSLCAGYVVTRLGAFVAAPATPKAPRTQLQASLEKCSASEVQAGHPQATVIGAGVLTQPSTRASLVDGERFSSSEQLAFVWNFAVCLSTMKPSCAGAHTQHFPNTGCHRREAAVSMTSAAASG